MKFDREQVFGGAADRDPAGSTAAIDMATLLGPGRLDDFLRQLETQVRNFLASLSQASPDGAAIRPVAHALVASAGMLGFRPLSECCGRIETSPDAMSARSLEEARQICAAALAEISLKYAASATEEKLSPCPTAPGGP